MTTLIIRSLEDAQDTAQILEKKGMKTEKLAIFSVEYDKVKIASLDDLDPKHINAVIVTSMKTAKAMENVSKKFKKLQIFSVGDKTTEKLKEVGFKKIKTGPGTAIELESMIQNFYKKKKDVNLLYVRGETVSYEFNLLANDTVYTLNKKIVYTTSYIDELPNNIVNSLKTGRISKVVVLSQNIADKFVELVHRAGLSQTCSSIKAYTLTDSVKTTLEQISFSAIIVPKKPKLPLLIKEVMKKKSYKVKLISIVILLIILAVCGTIGYYKFKPNENSMVSKFVNMMVPQDIFHKNNSKNKHKKNKDDQKTDHKNIDDNNTDSQKSVINISNDQNLSVADDNVSDDTVSDDTVSDDTVSDDTTTSVVNDSQTVDNTENDTPSTDTLSTDTPTTDTTQENTTPQDNINSQGKIAVLEHELSLLKSQLKANQETLNQINQKVESSTTNGETGAGNNNVYTSYALLLMVRQDVLAGRNPINSVNPLKKFMGDMATDQDTHIKIIKALDNLSQVNISTPQLPKLGASLFDVSYNGIVDYNYKQAGSMNNIKHYLYKIIKVRHTTHKANSAEDIIEKIKTDCLNNNYQDIERLFALLPMEIKTALADWHKQALIAIGNLKDMDYLQAILSQNLNLK